MSTTTEWLATISREYLDEFVPSGGAAVKFVVTSRTDTNLIDELAEPARERGFVTATVDGGATRLHQIEQIFWAVSRQVPWQELAAAVRARALLEEGWQLPPGTEVTFEAVATANGVLASHVRNGLQKWLTTNVFKDYHMSSDFRRAMMFLVLEPMATPLGETPLQRSILDWLNGEGRLLSALKPAQIYQKVARHTARDLFVSTGHWIKSVGQPGVQVVVDARATGAATRAATTSLFYGRPQLMDLYEVLRQFIDATDALTSTVITVVLPTAFKTDDVRGLHAYRALEMRIAEEIRDRTHDNPLAAMVQFSEATE